LAINRKELNLDPTLAQSFYGVQHRMMLDRAADGMIPGRNRTKNRKIVAFRATAGKHNLGRPAPHQPSHAPPSLFNGRTCLLSFLVDRRSIPKLPHQKRPHRLQHLWKQRSSSIRIEVNSPHPSILREPPSIPPTEPLTNHNSPLCHPEPMTSPAARS
jgi:hypothetical protein